MSPLVIADSDDESDSNEHLAAAPAVAFPPAQPRSPERGSLATASTDSVFFQQVFNEQNAAALEKVQQLQRDSDDALHESSAMTIPDVPFQRTTRGFYHSSTTTATDPQMDKLPATQMGNPPADWPQMPSGEGKHHETQRGADPWEVPSSPEAPGSLEKQSRRRNHKRLDQSHMRDESPSTKNALPDGHWDTEEVTQSRSKKRRRLDGSGGALSATDEVDLIMLPSSSKSVTQDGQETAATSSMPLPTMPLDAGSTFYPRYPSPTERGQPSHVGTDSAPTGPPKYNNLLLKQHTQYAVGSSGTATNINTQRTRTFSNQHLSSLAPEEQDADVETRKIEYRNYTTRRDSSPDIISTLAPVYDKAAHSEPEHSPDLISEPKPDQEYCDERDSSAHQPPPRELQSGENEAEFVARPTPMVESKKKRGRPRKPPETDEPLPMKPGPVSAAAAGTPAATTQKKKRGRPKKQPAGAAVDGAPPPAATAVSAVIAGSDTRANLGLAKTSACGDGDDIQAVIEQNSAETSSEKGAAKEASPAAEATRCGQDQAAPGSKEKTKDHTTSRSGPDKPKEEDASKEQRQPAARAREEKSGGDQKGSSAQGMAKPLYRVGLSKRFKIAPLLKSVRKP